MGPRRVAIGLWLAGLAFCIWTATHARFVADLSAFLPAAPTAEQRLLVDQLRDGALSRVMLIGIEGGDTAARAGISRSVARALAGHPLFTSVANGEASGFAREREFLLAHRYALSPNVTPGRFTVEGLRAAIADTLDLLASPAGLLVKSLVPRDPTGELLAALERMRPEGRPRSADGVWVSADGNRAIMIARTRAGGSDIDAQAQAMDAVERAFADAAAGVGARDAKLLLTGPGVFSVRSRAMIVRDVERLAIASTLVVATVLLVAYRSLTALALGLVPVVSGALAGVAAVALGFGTVHGITLGFGTTLIGEAVDYSIYLFVQAGHGKPPGGRDWLVGFWPTVRLGMLTSIAGFSALLFSGLPGLAQLGLYSIVGLVVAASVTRFVLPALLPAGFRIRDVSPLGERLGRIVAVAAKLRWVVPAAAVVAAATLVTHRDMLWDSELASLNPIPLSERMLDAELRAALGASDARWMIAVNGESADAALAAAERVGRRLDALVATGNLAGYESPARFLPSAAAQRARLACLPEPDELRKRLATALAQTSLRPEKLEPFIADVAAARIGPPITRETLNGTAFDAALDGLLFSNRDGQWTALLGLSPPTGGAIDAATVREAVANTSGAVLLDIKEELDHLYSGYLERAQIMSGVGAAAIVVLLLATLRSPVRVARVLMPLAAGVLVIAAGHILKGTRLSLLHLVGLLLVVAIGSNYALFFDRMAQVRDRSSARTLASLALANITTVASFGILSQSSIPVLNAIGSTAALGALCTLVFAAMLIRYNRANDHTGGPLP
ncbi:MAG TPA: MMPL family transporter [Casimicrobiaceae bacterium]|jgi:predicted exporter